MSVHTRKVGSPPFPSSVGMRANGVRSWPVKPDFLPNKYSFTHIIDISTESFSLSLSLSQNDTMDGRRLLGRSSGRSMSSASILHEVHFLTSPYIMSIPSS